MWRVMADRTMFKRKGNKAHIGRYGAVVWEGLKLVKTWNCCLFESSVPSANSRTTGPLGTPASLLGALPPGIPAAGPPEEADPGVFSASCGNLLT